MNEADRAALAEGHSSQGLHGDSSRRARCLVVTVSDTRSLADDPSGDRAASLLLGAGHSVLERRLVRDERESITAVAREAIARTDVDVVVFTGGTGIAQRDVTPEALATELDKLLEGFGEAFRRLSFEEIGPAAILSRAMAGVGGGTLLFALPGSTRAVALGVERLILPVLPHALQIVAA